ncbi:MAG: HlyD family efflux transporter periplasmic adaptor subunit [Christensenellaceae bacterium]|nr:HlyD family efflux transporter periplasmic adaptor subunit [Christensenellaceae bacterium]
MKKKLRKRLIWLMLLVAAAAAVWFFFLREQRVNFTEETARTMNIETFYTFSGNIEPDGAEIYAATASGSVRQWLVEEGDEVTDNTNVVVYENGTRVKSPRSGTVSDLYIDAGDDFRAGDALFRVADYAHPKIIIRVDEYDVSALKKGMPVSVNVLSTGAVVEGEITRIAQEATVSGDLAYYQTEITLPQDGTLAMGLTVEVLVPRQSAQNVTTVSMNAIQYDDNDEPFVYMYDSDGKVAMQPVSLGINNGTIVEITDGVRSGETVLVPPSFDFPMMPMMMRR